MVASFFDQLLPVLEVEGSILVELYTDGGDAEIGRRLAEGCAWKSAGSPNSSKTRTWMLKRSLVAPKVTGTSLPRRL
jgi:hypothetical protein